MKNLTKLILIAMTISLCPVMNVNAQMPSTIVEKKSKKKSVKRDVDAIGKALGYTDGQTTFYEMIGAEDGKEFNGGEFEIYLFDPTSDSYKDLISGKNDSLKVSAYQKGVILIFANEENEDIIKKFKTLSIRNK